VISGSEEFGDFFAPEGERFGVKGESEESIVGVGVVLVRFGGAEDAGEEPDDAVGHGEGREFAAGEDKIADGETVGGDLGSDAFINAFVVSADEDDVVELTEGFGVGLGESLASGICEDDCGLGGGGAGMDGGFDDGSHHDHSGAASIGGIIDSAVLIGGEIAGILGGE